jgi:hypothetical protein
MKDVMAVRKPHKDRAEMIKFYKALIERFSAQICKVSRISETDPICIDDLRVSSMLKDLQVIKNVLINNKYEMAPRFKYGSVSI